MIAIILTEYMFFISGIDNPQLLSTSPMLPTPRVEPQPSTSSLPIRGAYTSDICSTNLIKSHSGKFISYIHIIISMFFSQK